jgi:tetratricopeptide (TPR) repeat protein
MTIPNAITVFWYALTALSVTLAINSVVCSFHRWFGGGSIRPRGPAAVLILAATGLYTMATLQAIAQQPPSTASTQRFDYLVRGDFFAGVAGDEARLKKAMDVCERTLAENPKHAEALVWHGAGLLVQSGRAFKAGDMGTGSQLWARGLKEMDDAVALQPDNVGVLIPRGATLFEATRSMNIEMARPLLESALANYERVLAIQSPYFQTLGDHAKGELLFGLADGYHRLGQHEKARTFFERIIRDAPTSGQVPKAREWMETGAVPKSAGPSCVGCHK